MTLRYADGAAGACCLKLIVLTAALLALAAPAPAIAQCVESEIPMWGGQQKDSDYGDAVAVSGDLALVGAPRWRPGVGLPPEGLVTLAEWNGSAWDTSQLVSMNEMWSDFGAAVAINETGDMLAVGAPGSSQFLSQQGMVMLYDYDGGLTGAMMGVGDYAGDELGSSVDASGDLIVAGAPSFSGDDGYVKVYRRVAPGSWTIDATLHSTTHNEQFGTAVAVSGNRIAVGAPRRYDSTLGFIGAVTVYEHDGASWVQVLELLGTDANLQLGRVLDLSGDLMVIGIPGWNGMGQAQLGRWVDDVYEELLTTSASTINWQLGAAVAVSGSRCAVGVPNYDQAPLGTIGGVELAHHVPGYPTPWILSPSGLTSGAPEDWSQFGRALALSGTRLLVASPNAEDFAGDTVGRVVSIELDDSIGFTDLGHELAGQGGQAPTLAGYAPPCLEPRIYKVVTGARPLAIAHLVLGFAELNADFKGGVMVPTLDLLVSPLLIDGAGTLALSSPLPKGLPALTIYTQLWIEDIDGPAGFSASNGLRSDIPSF